MVFKTITINYYFSFRLLKYDPKTKRITVLMKNLQFANGVELSEMDHSCCDRNC